MRISRTYPQPDSPEPQIGPRERALAVFKYLLDLEPEAAVLHPLFACIVHAFEQAIAVAVNSFADDCAWCDEMGTIPDVEPSLVPLLTSVRELVPRTEHADEGKL
jgi:hypothetical protein